MKKELLNIVVASIPTILSNFAYPIKDMISFRVVGYLEDKDMMAALGLGITWTSLFGTAIYLALGIGFNILASQAFGARNHIKFGSFYQKIRIMNGFLFMIVATLLFNSESILLSFGTTPILSQLTGKLLRTWILAFIPITYYFGANFYLVSQGYFNVGAVIAAIAVPLHWFYCQIFVLYLHGNLEGLAIAETCTRTSMCLIIYTYTAWSNPWPEASIPWTLASCFTGFVDFAKEVLIYGSSIILELVAFEFPTIMISKLHETAILAGHAVSLNLVYTIFTPIYGTSIASSVLIGNAVGAQQVERTKSLIQSSVHLTSLWATVIFFVLFLFRESIILLYTDNMAIASIASSIMLLFALGIHADGISNTLSYGLRAIGYKSFVFKSYCLTQYAFALTLSVILSFGFNFSYTGIWLGIILGFYAMAACLLWKVKSIDLNGQIIKIAKEMKRESSWKIEDEEASNEKSHIQFAER